MIAIIVGIALLIIASCKKGEPMNEVISTFRQWETFFKENSQFLDYKLVFAIAYVESRCKPDAIGPTKDYGIMQITAIVLKEYNDTFKTSIPLAQLLNPETGVRIGSWYLNRLVHHYDLSVPHAVQAYNTGVGNVRKNPKSGVSYASKVFDIYYSIADL